MTTIDKVKTKKEEIGKEAMAENPIEYKTYKTVDEQIEYLKANKKIFVSEKHKDFLYERNYISIINPYKEFFAVGKNQKKNHIYKESIDFIEIMKLIKVDDAFSHQLYAYISIFERKFKNILITEMCNKYMVEPLDKECIIYIDEIQNFLCSPSEENLPRFCPSLFYQLTKGGEVVQDSFGIQSKMELLKHIVNIGAIKSSDNDYSKKSNKLIKHYLNSQGIVPLWVIPNALTLGELKILFGMLDVNSQKKIAAIFLSKDNWEKLNSKDILSFSGILESIRNIRNTINHFEPLFPYLQEQLKSCKKMTDSQLIKVLHILKQNYDASLLADVKYIEEKEIKSNPSTKRNIDILSIMKNYIK